MDESLLHKQLMHAAGVVRQYAGSDCAKAVIEMLDLLGQSYLMDFIRITERELPALQAKIKQVYAMREVLCGEGVDSPKV